MRPLAVAVLIAAAGLAGAYRWFPSADATGKFPATLSRAEAIEKASVLAERYGRDVRGAQVRVSADFDERNYEFRRTGTNRPLALVPQPVNISVVFMQFPWQVRVVFGGNGVPTRISLRDGPRSESLGRELTAAEEQQILDDFTGLNGAGQYRKINSVSRGAEGHVTTWEWSNEDEPDSIQQLEAVSSQAGIRSVEMRTEFSASFIARWVARFGAEGFRYVALLVLTFLGIALTNAFFFAGLARGHIRLKPALRMLGGLLLIWALGYVGGAGLDKLLIEADAKNQPPPELFLPVFGGVAAVSALFAAMWAVGRALMRRAGLERWHSMDALLEGAWWRRQVGRSTACGLLLGSALAAIPIGLSAAHIFPRPAAFLASASWLGAAWPATLPASLLMPWDLSGIFFLLVPMASTPSGRRWVPVQVRWLVAAALGWFAVSMVRYPFYDQAGNLVAGALLLAAFSVIYLCFDVLAVFMAELGYSTALVAIYFLHQDSSALAANAAQAALPSVVLVLAGAAALLWAPAWEPVEEGQVVEIAAEREVLATEFAMAREAQQRLLPEIPPRLDGFSLAASCYPARDVGGDLYGFFRFPDGSYGLCVADVSGKGVPAALYMTMTQGILAAASRDTADLPAIASALNLQIYAAARKKTFVTMALGRLDIPSRTLTHVRAGHNSILLRRADGQCEYRKPRGVGLGLTPGRLFDRAIELDSLPLAAGDLVVFYSDGITEAMNAGRELFGEDRLVDVVSGCGDHDDAAQVQQAILHRVHAFMAGEPPHDDMTLLVIRG